MFHLLFFCSLEFPISGPFLSCYPSLLIDFLSRQIFFWKKSFVSFTCTWFNQFLTLVKQTVVKLNQLNTKISSEDIATITKWAWWSHGIQEVRTRNRPPVVEVLFISMFIQLNYIFHNADFFTTYIICTVFFKTENDGLFAPLHIFQTSTTLRIWINSWKDSILLDKRLYSKSSLALTLEWHSCEVHSRGVEVWVWVEFEWYVVLIEEALILNKCCLICIHWHHSNVTYLSHTRLCYRAQWSVAYFSSVSCNRHCY